MEDNFYFINKHKNTVADTLVPVQDGAGNNSPLLMSQNAMQFTKMMAIPCWTTEERPQNPLMGTLGLNTTSQEVEVWTGEQWKSF
jgi:hypothetical protein